MYILHPCILGERYNGKYKVFSLMLSIKAVFQQGQMEAVKPYTSGVTVMHMWLLEEMEATKTANHLLYIFMLDI